jgi:uncharacterized protein (DUF2141 family)
MTNNQLVRTVNLENKTRTVLMNKATFLSLASYLLLAIGCGSPVEEGNKSIPAPTPNEQNVNTDEGSNEVPNAENEDSVTSDELNESTSDTSDTLVEELPTEDIEPTSTLGLSFDKLKHTRGQVCISLFQGGKGFPDDDNSAVLATCFEADSKEGPILELEAGKSYGIAVFHDENRNEILDKRKLGPWATPKEGYGFSKNPGFKPRAPKYSEIDFTAKEGFNVMKINFMYLF